VEFVEPEAVVAGAPVDDRVNTEVVEQLDLLGRGDDPERDAPPLRTYCTA